MGVFSTKRSIRSCMRRVFRAWRQASRQRRHPLKKWRHPARDSSRKWIFSAGMNDWSVEKDENWDMVDRERRRVLERMRSRIWDRLRGQGSRFSLILRSQGYEIVLFQTRMRVLDLRGMSSFLGMYFISKRFRDISTLRYFMSGKYCDELAIHLENKETWVYRIVEDSIYIQHKAVVPVCPLINSLFNQ